MKTIKVKIYNAPVNRPAAAIILAAGNSARMGCPKAHLPYGNGNTFAQQITRGFLAFGCNPVIMVIQDGADFTGLQTENLVPVINREVEKGRSHSIHLGLQSLPEGACCFIHNIDNTCPPAGLLEQMTKALPAEGYVVPVYEGRGGHPLLLGWRMAKLLQEQAALEQLVQALPLTWQGARAELLAHLSATPLIDLQQQYVENGKTAAGTG